MTGVSWFDWLTVVAFVALAAVSLGRLVRRRTAGEPADAAAHGVMAVGMAAMALPTGNPVPTGVWVAAFGLVGAWAAGAAVRSASTGWRPWTTPPPIRGPGPPPAGAAGTGSSRLPLAGAAHHVAASVLMIVLLTTAHPAHHDTKCDTHLTHHHPAHHHAGEVASAAALSPPTPLIIAAGLGFLAYAAWLAAGLLRPRATRCSASGVAMAAGMGLMALSMA